VPTTTGDYGWEWVLPVSTQTIRNTIPNATKKERKRIIGIPPLRFHAFQMGVNCGKREIDMKPNAISPNYFFLLFQVPPY
jgi:hypothetical protein